MTDAEKVAFVRTIGDFPETDTDAVLSAYLTIAKTEIMNRAYPYGYTDETPFPSKYDMKQCKIAVYMLNKRGAEGQLSHSENGISRSYGGSDLPVDMLSDIVPFCSSIRGVPAVEPDPDDGEDEGDIDNENP